MKINYNKRMIRVRLTKLMEEKEKREGHKISLLQVSKSTGIPYTTIYSWAHDDLTRFDANVAESLCRYFGVEVGELLELGD